MRDCQVGNVKSAAGAVVDSLEARRLYAAAVTIPEIVDLTRDGHSFRAVKDEWIITLADGYDGVESTLSETNRVSAALPSSKLSQLLTHNGNFAFDKYLGDTRIFKIRAPGKTYEQIYDALAPTRAVASIEPNLIGTMASSTPTEITTRSSSNGRYWYDKIDLINSGNGVGGWDYSKGSKSVVVGVLDSGVAYTHPNLDANVYKRSDGSIGGVDYWDNDGQPLDEQKHGTEVAGVLSGEWNDGTDGSSTVGVNPNSKYMPLRITTQRNDRGETVDFQLDRAIEAVAYVSQQ